MLQQRGNYALILLDVLKKLKQEDVVSKNIIGLRIREIVEHVEKYKDSPVLAKLAAELCSQVECCIPGETWGSLPLP